MLNLSEYQIIITMLIFPYTITVVMRFLIKTSSIKSLPLDMLGD